MIRIPTPNHPWYIETRNVDDPEKVSLDLARHLPQRSAVGTIVVVADRPTVLLPVIRKRWTKIIREVERQHSSTLDRIKKDSLGTEVVRLKALTFAANTAYVAPPANIIFTSPEHPYVAQTYCTLYLMLPLSEEQLRHHTQNLPKGSVIVQYF